MISHYFLTGAKESSTFLKGDEVFNEGLPWQLA